MPPRTNVRDPGFLAAFEMTLETTAYRTLCTATQSAQLKKHDTHNPNPTKTRCILAVSEGGESGSRGHVSVQLA